MFKIMIVDDEWLVQEGIKVTLENHFDNIEIVGMVSSGREAIEMNAAKHPDIILMDIKMPGINGIEAIQTIRGRFSQTKFVIISAYEQFDYAKQAVELGVVDYILKPINQNKLVEVLNKAMDKILEEREQRSRLIKNREKLEKMMPVLEKGFIYSLLMHGNFKHEVKKYCDIMEIHNEDAYVMTLEIKDSEEAISIQGDALYKKIQDTIKYKCKCAVGPLIINRVTVVVFSGALSDEYDQRVEAVSLAESITASLEKSDVQVKIGVGACLKLERLRHSLEQASYALSKMATEAVLHHNDVMVSTSSDYSYMEVKDDQEAILLLVESGQIDKLREQLHVFFDKISRNFDEVSFRNVLMELIVMVLSTSYKHELSEAEVGYSTYISEFRRITSQNQLTSWSYRKIILVAETIQSSKTSHVSNVILKAKTYIDENFDKDIGLNDVSKEVSISPQYFSTIFKEELGLNFIEYLRNKRVEVAKELLRDKKFSVKEICYKVGYNDPNYFSRLFKKLVGVSPTEFK
ncbi:response regulator [Acidaminobacter sp. JC074]|uniref:response regulator transcription factor n=1 Tax=Acidaminobacter sp. JC074 TaxID=2530199 RepID=UPI001F1095FA|nr:response regulator [Acidaminobacter sp. JC074]MCH4888541.1 response regulator [Acidaminobacter sp. JC074]